MHIPSRFTIAIHTILCIACFSPQRKVTSTFLAASTNANAVIVRRILGQLKEAGLVQVAAGVGGATVAKPLADITLLDIFLAVEAADTAFFGFQDNTACQCPLGQNIHTVLDAHLHQIQLAMQAQMQSTTLQTLYEQTLPFVDFEKCTL